MRPLRLSMTGFGPYKNKTEIDMASLGTGGLYLVTGDTGAGKTFIFDAITFALYGDMSGSGRDTRTVRSQYSDPDSATSVELDFEYNGKVYKVVRNPEYTRAKKRGEGTAKEQAGATLTMPDGSIVDGSSRVSEEIKSILGIDRSQFRSIAMIAQGEFRDVLNSSTDERIRLFRKLFDTELYDRLTSELSGIGKEVRDKYDRKQADLRAALTATDCRFDDELAAELSELKSAEQPSAKDAISILEKIIERGNVLKKDTEIELETAETELQEAGNRLALIDQYKENTESLEKAKAAAADLSAKEAAAKEALYSVDGINKEIDKLKSEYALIEGNMDSYDRLDAVIKELKEIDDSIEEKSQRLEQASFEKDKAENKYKDLLKEKEELKYSGEQLVKIKNDIERASNRITILDALISDIRKVKELEADLAIEQEELAPLIDEAEQAENKLSSMRSAYLREQAGILASDLTEGEPCPVCGSLHHPEPADLSKDAPTAAEIEEAEKDAKSASEKANNKTNTANKIKGSLNASSFSAKETALKETGTDDLDKASKIAEEDKAGLEADLEKYNSECSELEAKTERYSEIGKEEGPAKQAYDDLVKETSDLSTELAGLSASSEGAARRKQDVKKFLLFDSRSDASARMAEIEGEIKSKSDTIKDLTEAYNKAVSDRQANEAGISQLEKIIEGFKQDDEEEAREAGYNAEQKKRGLGDLITKLSSDLDVCGTALSGIKRIESDLNAIRKEHELIDALVRTASGSLTGKDRISLETYVQTYYFDRVIKRANQRLIRISGGRYEFARGSESRDKRSHNGLDLEVVDHYGGSRRPVSTLSGGESFIASLSLALGLSDEVQASAGGIQLDTMFVDEGFGSLDSETLELAIRTLTELSGEGLLVGIISHVDALKSRIDKQIVVTKDRANGSRVQVIS